MRYRITVRGTGIMLRGWVDGDEKVREFAGALAVGMDPTDPLLVVSPDPAPEPVLLVPPMTLDESSYHDLLRSTPVARSEIEGQWSPHDGASNDMYGDDVDG